jgi:hypothetical protein
VFVPNNVLLELLLSNEVLHAAAGPFSGALDLCKVCLFTNAASLGPTTAFGDLTPPTFTGYAQQTITWAAQHRRLPSGIYINGGYHGFQKAAADPAPTLYGWGLVDSTGLILYGAELFPQPVTLVTELDLLAFVPEFGLGADFGQVAMVA